MRCIMSRTKIASEILEYIHLKAQPRYTFQSLHNLMLNQKNSPADHQELRRPYCIAQVTARTIVVHGINFHLISEEPCRNVVATLSSRRAKQLV